MLKVTLSGLRPVCMAIGPILGFYSLNITEFHISDISRPLAAATLLVLAVWAILSAWMRSSHKASLIVSLLALLFWNSSNIARALTPADSETGLIVWAILGSLWLGAPFLAIRLKRMATELNRIYYTMTSLVAFISVAAPILIILTSNVSMPIERMTDSTIEQSVTLPASRPDIYLIVLDAYGRDDDLSEYFGIRRGLGQRLSALGFYVARWSNTNYSTTLHAIPSILNYDYIPNLIQEINAPALVDSIWHSKIMRQVKQRGYKFISYSTGLYATDMHHADAYLQPSSTAASLAGRQIRMNAFEGWLLQGTPIGSWMRRGKLSPYVQHRARVINALIDLPRHTVNPEPTFVFAHILAPHEPFVFGENGEDVSPYEIEYRLNRIFNEHNPPAEPGRIDPEYARRYRLQANYIGDLVEDAVSEILANSPEPPIIIVQGDHGPYGFSPNPRHTRWGILNAYYLPNNGSSALYDSISPVNSFRVIMNYYFGANLPLLPDRRFLTDWSTPDQFEEVLAPAPTH